MVKGTNILSQILSLKYYRNECGILIYYHYLDTIISGTVNSSKMNQIKLIVNQV